MYEYCGCRFCYTVTHFIDWPSKSLGLCHYRGRIFSAACRLASVPAPLLDLFPYRGCYFSGEMKSTIGKRL